MKIHCRFCTFFVLCVCTVIAVVPGCKTSPPSAPADTPPTVAITSPANSEICRLTDTVFVDAADDKGVTKVELYINGSLSSTDQSAPWRFIWETELWDDGNYTLMAKAYDAGGHVSTSAPVTMTIHNAFTFTFVNTVFTPISITVQGVTLTAQPGDSAIYEFTTNPRSVVYTASTSGKTTGGSTIGRTLNWGGSSYPIDVSLYSSYRLQLIVSSNYFFLYVKNTGYTTLGPLYVNYGLTDQTRDDISIPQSATNTYQIGYYRAYTNTQVRAYWAYPNTTTYSYWNQGTQFTLPFTANQAATLTNPY
ncbi:MAG TPA: Ig-like domain-containing protein, partial [Bacteroidota bacterium]